MYFGMLASGIWLLMMIGMFGGLVVLLVALWRGMKAHEIIARTMTSISENLRNMSQKQNG